MMYWDELQRLLYHGTSRLLALHRYRNKFVLVSYLYYGVSCPTGLAHMGSARHPDCLCSAATNCMGYVRCTYGKGTLLALAAGFAIWDNMMGLRQ